MKKYYYISIVITEVKSHSNYQRKLYTEIITRCDYIQYVLLFIHLLIAVLDFHCCEAAFSSCGARPSHLWWLLLSQSKGSGVCGLQSLQHAGSAVVAHRLSCFVGCEIVPDQGSYLCPLHWKVDSPAISYWVNLGVFNLSVLHFTLCKLRILKVPSQNAVMYWMS